MPKRISHEELEKVADAVSSFQGGASLDDITGALGSYLSRRTLQRRLSLLVEQGILVHEGKGRGSRFALPKDVVAPSTDDRAGVQDRQLLPLSLEANAIQRSVGTPLSDRKPVGYNRRFLDDYEPNRSFYLSATVREELATQGRLPEASLPPGTHARKILNRLLIDLSWNSSRLEGNTYSILETERLLEFGESAGNKDAREAQMILNHKAAIELLVDQAAEIGFNPYTICNLHALLSDNLLSDPGACGRVRSIPVSITGTVFHPLEGPQVIDECFKQML